MTYFIFFMNGVQTHSLSLSEQLRQVLSDEIRAVMCVSLIRFNYQTTSNNYQTTWSSIEFSTRNQPFPVIETWIPSVRRRYGLVEDECRARDGDVNTITTDERRKKETRRKWERLQNRTGHKGEGKEDEDDPTTSAHCAAPPHPHLTVRTKPAAAAAAPATVRWCFLSWCCNSGGDE